MEVSFICLYQRYCTDCSVDAAGGNPSPAAAPAAPAAPAGPHAPNHVASPPTDNPLPASTAPLDPSFSPRVGRSSSVPRNPPSSPATSPGHETASDKEDVEPPSKKRKPLKKRRNDDVSFFFLFLRNLLILFEAFHERSLGAL